MNENETDPRSADAAPESKAPESTGPEMGSPDQGSSPERAESELPPASPLSVGSWDQQQAQSPQSPQPQSPEHQSPEPQSPQPPQSPWQQPPAAEQQHPTVQMPYEQHPGYGAYQQPQYAQQPGYQQQYAQQSAYAAWSQQQATAAGQQPGAEGTPPTWVAPVGTDTQAPQPPGRGRKIFVAGAAAVLIALASGGVGAATALAVDKEGNSPAIQTSNSSVSRVVDRSSLAQIASSVQDSVVSITTESGEGSGVILSADGYIVTNNHVVATAQGKTVTVIFSDGKKVTADIVGTDQRDDLAVVKASGVSGLHAATFGSSAKMEVGDTVLAIGSPLGLEGSVTAGIISAKDRTIQSSSEDQQPQQGDPFGGGSQQQQQQQQGTSNTMSGLLQTDAPINPGNSGGALVNTNGEVIGINSAIATQGQGSGNIGLGFAIPSDKASSIAKDLMAGKQPAHPALGVSVADAENGGALVSNVTANSAAAKAGLQQGDVITAVDGKAINSSDDLVTAVQSASVGQKMSIDFTRNGAKKTVSVTLAEAQ
ncbi:MAG TPA: trypsin-like peptidase domain-containing protein [Actinoplanes sp.]|jgi:putative serine protease PepD